MTYKAYYLPSKDGEDISKGGFPTEQHAYSYIESMVCDDCRKGFNTACYSEWMVDEEDEDE